MTPWTTTSSSATSRWPRGWAGPKRTARCEAISEKEFLDMRVQLPDDYDVLLVVGVEAKLEVDKAVIGGPAKAIEHIADRMKADLIVVGRHGHSRLAGVLLGGVTDRLLHIAARPVLTVPPREG